MRLITIITICTLWGTVCSPFAVYGQNTKKQKKVTHLDLSQADSLQAEAFFIEATQEYLNNNYDKAISLYEKVKNSYPKESSLYHQIAKCYHAKSNLAEALKYDGIAIELSPKNRYYYLQLGDYLREIKAWNELENCFTKMLNNCNGVDLYYYDLANIHVYLYRNIKYQFPHGNVPKKESKAMANHYAKALTAFDEYEKRLGIDSEAILDKQEFLILAGKNDLAIIEGKKLVNLYPNKGSYAIKTAQIIKQENGAEAALKYLLDINNKQNFDKGINKIIVSYFIQQEQYKELNTFLDKSISKPDYSILDKVDLLTITAESTQKVIISNKILKKSDSLQKQYPKNINLAYLSADILYFKREYKNARTKYLIALDQEPKLKKGWQKIIEIDVTLENSENLTNDLSLAILHFPKEANFNAQLGLVNIQNGKPQNAIDYLTKASKQTNRTELKVRYFGLIALSYQDLKQYKKSDSIFEEALVISPNNDIILNNYAYNLSERKAHLNKAKSMAKRLTLLYPNQPNYLDTYGWVLFQQEKYKEASIFLEKAASQSQNAEIYEHYGDVLSKLDRVNEAKKWWQKAIDHNADNSEELIKKIKFISREYTNK